MKLLVICNSLLEDPFQFGSCELRQASDSNDLSDLYVLSVRGAFSSGVR